MTGRKQGETKPMAASAASVPAVPQLDPESNLSRYLRDIRKFPLLEPDEEFMLAKRWREHEDAEAAHRLVTSHLRLVAKIASGYRGYGLPMGELISEGNVGMMQAVKRFDPDRGFRLATYAMWWIRASIQEYILRSWSLVKIGTTAAQKKLFFNLRRIKGEIKAIEEGDLHPENVAEIATRLNVLRGRGGADEPPHGGTRQLAQRAAPRRRRGRVDGLAGRRDRVAGNPARRGRGAGQAPGAAPQRDGAPEPAREAHPHHAPPGRETLTLEELSQEFGVSRERVRQIEVRAFEKIQKAMRMAVVEEERALAG